MIYVAQICRLGEPWVLVSHQQKAEFKMKRESQVTTEHWHLLTWCRAGMGEHRQDRTIKMFFCFGGIVENKID